MGKHKKRRFVRNKYRKRYDKIRKTFVQTREEYDASLKKLQEDCPHTDGGYHDGMSYSDGGWECFDCGLELLQPPVDWEPQDRERGQ